LHTWLNGNGSESSGSCDLSRPGGIVGTPANKHGYILVVKNDLEDAGAGLIDFEIRNAGSFGVEA
jgi:hypothetical protein